MIRVLKIRQPKMFCKIQIGVNKKECGKKIFYLIKYFSIKMTIRNFGLFIIIFFLKVLLKNN